MNDPTPGSPARAPSVIPAHAPPVIPANAGIHCHPIHQSSRAPVETGVRRDDKLRALNT